VNVFNKLASKYKFKILFINNASSDTTLELIKKVIALDHRVEVISHSRNFGYQASIFSGLTNSSGDAFFIIDVDCEDPPELLGDFVLKYEQGYDLVYGERISRPEFFLISFARKLFYRITRLIADSEFINDMAEFSLISNRLRAEVVKSKSSFPFVRSSFGYVGFKRVGIPYRRSIRSAGKTHYNFLRMSQFAIAGILTASTFPLRLIGYVGVCTILLNLFDFFTKKSYSFQSFVDLVNSTFYTFSFVFIAVYIARIYKNSCDNPIYIIDQDNSHFRIDSKE
jgi:dolichol-phosphate mannosyltransferase